SGASSAASFAGEYRFDAIHLRGGAGLDAGDPVEVTDFDLVESTRLPPLVIADDLTVRSDSSVTASSGSSLDLVASSLLVEAGGELTMAGRGYGGGNNSDTSGRGPDGIVRARSRAGGSYGGVGKDGTYAGNVGEVYGSVYVPQSLGAGGGRGSSGENGGAGGGRITLDATSVTIDGDVRVSGNRISGTYAGAGAGGTLVVYAQTLTGSGAIYADGGDDKRTNSRYGGLGGGGRVALWADQVVGFDPATQVFAEGGSRIETSGAQNHHAAAGTVFVKQTGDTWGELIVQAHRAGTEVRATVLPSLGEGAVVAATGDGADLVITGAEAFRPRWRGVWVTLLDAAGAELGSYRTAAVTADGALRLEGASTVSGAVSYRGEYRFDRMTVLGGAAVDTDVPITVAEVELRDEARLPNRLAATDLTLRAGAVVRPAVGSDLHLEVSGTLHIEAGAEIDLYARGYDGGAGSDTLGHSPAGVGRAPYRVGGSHGGVGRHGSTSNRAAEEHDSVYVPSYAGAGGGRGSSGENGGDGGGLLVIDAGQVIL
ncbi:MAG: hypothetical protein AAFX50_15165, partial [Acidobacteriota bacterium]